MATRLHKALAVGAAVVVLALAARMAAPVLVERYVNRQLADMGEYRGSVADVDLFMARRLRAPRS